MTPGAFLRAAREAAGLSLDDVALRTDTTPPVCARERAALVAAFEEGRARPSGSDVAALQAIYRFDWDDLFDCDADPAAPRRPIDAPVLWPVA